MTSKHNHELVPLAKKLRQDMTKEERHLWYDFLRSYPIRFLRQKIIGQYRNVERFANYLRNLSKKTQFIVITHRRGTMEASDVLYGVTMQEQGISKILHLDLNQMEQQIGIIE